MNHLFHLLQDYQPQADDEDWYCATVVTKSGSSYRRPGAMMLVNPWGKSYGLVSGGDLPESIALSILSECHAAIFNPGAMGLKTSQLGLGA